MIEYVNSFLLLTTFGSTSYVYYRLKKFFYLISILMDSEILDQLVTNLEKSVDSEVTKSNRGCKKKTDTKMNEVEENDVRDKRERLVACILSGNSKNLGKEYTEQQINEMDSYNINALSNRYESALNAQMTKSFGKSVINLYSNVACSVLGVGNQQDLSNDSECEPFLNTALQ